jgi:hypothetical protein
MTETKTHFRKVFDSPYLSSADIVDPVILTIKRVTQEQDYTKKTKDVFNTAHFVEREIRPGEKLKPMILNATNSKFLAQLTGSKWIEDWQNVAVTVFVDAHVRFGKETVEGLRLAKTAQRPSAPQALIEEAETAADSGTEFYSKWWKETGQENRKLIGGTRHDALKLRAERADAKAPQGAGE